MSVWVKICGLKDAGAIEAAVTAGANAIGFVFADSVRRIEPDVAQQLAAPWRAQVAIVAVMRHPSSIDCEAVCDVLKPDYLQTDAADYENLRLPPGIAPLPVFRDGEQLPPSSTALCLYEGRDSGTGEAADWQRAASLAQRSSIVLAGGLSPANVGQAIEHVKPWGVDVSSGVESERGRKSPSLIKQFIVEARSAVLHGAADATSPSV